MKPSATSLRKKSPAFIMFPHKSLIYDYERFFHLFRSLPCLGLSANFVICWLNVFTSIEFIKFEIISGEMQPIYLHLQACDKTIEPSPSFFNNAKIFFRTKTFRSVIDDELLYNICTRDKYFLIQDWNTTWRRVVMQENFSFKDSKVHH